MRMVNISNEKSMQSYTARCSRYKNKYTNLVCGKTAVGRNYNLPRDILQATELGIASCIISRGEETFASEMGQKLLREWEVPENYSCQCFVILGILDGEVPKSKPRKPGRVKIVE